MRTTNRDLFQFDNGKEQLLMSMDDLACRRELDRIYPRFSQLCPALALTWFRLCRIVRRWWKSPFVYAIRFETRNILPRIRFQSSERPYLDICRAHSYQEDASGCLVPDRRMRTRIQDMQALSASHSWFGIADEWAFHQGWEAGARWTESTSRISQTESWP